MGFLKLLLRSRRLGDAGSRRGFTEQREILNLLVRSWRLFGTWHEA